MLGLGSYFNISIGGGCDLYFNILFPSLLPFFISIDYFYMCIVLFLVIQSVTSGVNMSTITIVSTINIKTRTRKFRQKMNEE